MNPYFSCVSPLDGETRFFILFLFFLFEKKPFKKKMVFGVATYFCYFFKGDSLFRKKHVHEKLSSNSKVMLPIGKVR